ncbi:Hypothetical protein PHPALM_19619 [Phytophthora palmivora]|uniref:Uncharacterized protein n=1 Tax=Phytophthora palmivora TaxID=4796 RepID=A0A2P4XGZ0_9STRA|nr:Hypothetical protein PHPALM_19619 [Phytophthora palmivora]
MNSLPAATTEPSFRRLVATLSNLHNFGRINVLKATVDFLDDFADEGEPDRATAKAWRFQIEFTLRASLLAELLYDLQKDKVEALKALVESKQTTAASTVRQSGNAKSVSKVHKNVSRTLPKQGSMQLLTLSKEDKDHITTHFGGLAPEFAEL